VKCEAPIVIKGQAHPCGRCLPCLFNRRRIWTHRILLEAQLHEDNSFLTLTYRDDALPGGSPLPSLMPKHYRDWLKRFRKTISPLRVRYFVVGEYGDETQRPHYHAALFGFPTCLRGRTLRRLGSTRAIWEECCSICQLVGKTWGHGDVDLGMLETSSAQYISGYVTKKMTMRDDYRLKGREPEFARMSLRPGIGADFMHEVASGFMQFNLEKTQVDVPSTLRHGNREMPLGRYLTKRLRKLTGRDEKAPQIVQDKIQADLQGVRDAAFNRSVSFASALKEANAPLVKSFKARQQIFTRKKTL